MRPSSSSSSSSSSPSSTPKSPYHHVIESKSISGDLSSPCSLPPTTSTSSSAALLQFPSFGFLDRFFQTLVADDAFDSLVESFTSTGVVPNARRRVFHLRPQRHGLHLRPQQEAAHYCGSYSIPMCLLQIVDGPTQGHIFLSREYVQPKWVFDCMNARILLPTDAYSVRSMVSELTRDDRQKLYSSFGLLYSYGHEELAICEDVDQVVRFNGEEEEDYCYCYPKFMRLLELDPNLVMDLQSLEETHKNMNILKQLANGFFSAPQEQPDNSSLLWLSVPYDVMGLILERLPQADFIRFEAVCHDWQEVRQRHRCDHPRFKPHAIPWLMPQAHYRRTPCISMLEKRIYRLTFPDYVSCMHRLFSSDGWILLYEGRWQFSEFLLLNPITREQIELPRLWRCETLTHGCMAPDPNDDNYSLIVGSDYAVYLWRRGDPNWISLHTNCEPARNVSSVYSVGIYYLKLMNLNCRRARRGDLLILNPAAPQPSLQLIEMEWEIDPLQVRVDYLVSIDLEIVLIQPIWAFGCKIFKADLNQSMWMELQSFRGKTVFLSRSCCFAQSSEEIGGKDNVVVFPRGATFSDWFLRGEGRNNVWRRYFVNSGRVDGGCVPASGTYQDVVIFMKSNLFWLVPSLKVEVEVDTSTLNTIC